MGELINLKDRQKENNKRVLERLQDKEDNLANSSVQDSWFPSRGIFDRNLGRMVPAKPSEETIAPTQKKTGHLRLVTNQ